MTQEDEEFKAFQRENPNIGPLGPGQDPKIKYPRFRHYEYIPPRSASNVNDTEDTGGRVIDSPTLSPVSSNETPGISPTKTPTLSPTFSQGNGGGEGDGGGNNDGGGDDDGDDGSNGGGGGDDGSNGGGGGGGSGNDDDGPNVTKPVIDCGIDENGDVNVVPTASKKFVDYKYNIITDPGSANLETEILPVLEKKLLEFILPDLFQCESDIRRLSWHSKNIRRKLQLVGASSSPPDLVSTSDFCVADNEAHECNVVDGMMTFYHDSDDIDMSTIKGLTCDALNGDNLKMAHPAIMGLECIADDAAPVPEPGTGIGKGEPPLDPSATQRYTTPVAVMSALAAVMVVLGLYAYRRRKNREEEIIPHKKHLDDSDVNNSNSMSFDDLPMAWSAQSKGNGLAFDMKSIVPTGYNPETIEECPKEEENELDEVSLDQLEMNIDDSDLS